MPLLIISVVVMVLGFLHVLFHFFWVPRQSPIFPELKRPLMLAHQGGEALAPTNTIAAFEKAEQIGGSDFLDIDIHLTKDGHIVGIHDATVDRTTNGRGRVDSFTLAELQGLDAGYHFKDLQGNYSYRGQGVKISDLEEVFKVYGQKFYLHFEIKDSYPKGAPSQIEEKLWYLIQQYSMEKRVIVSSFQQDIMRRFSNLAGGQVVLGASQAEVTQFVITHKLGIPGFYRRHSQVLEIPTRSSGINLKDRRLIAGAHRRGMEVYYWTIDDKAEMRELLALGADGLFTNRPDLLKEVLGEMNLR